MPLLTVSAYIIVKTKYSTYCQKCKEEIPSDFIAGNILCQPIFGCVYLLNKRSKLLIQSIYKVHWGEPASIARQMVEELSGQCSRATAGCAAGILHNAQMALG